MQLLQKNEISRAVINCRPNKVAVAYIGADWKKYISDISKLKSIILSPTLGTNPKAVNEVARKIGWENVHFLDELHAKIYLGETSAVVGSANLTRNGLSGDALIELCVELTNHVMVKQIESFIMSLIVKAKKQYPSESDKKKRLTKLQSEINAVIASGALRHVSKDITDFRKFELLGNDDFYVSWYIPDGEGSYSDGALRHGASDENCLDFSPEDRISRNKWILCWQMTKSNRPDKRVPLEWLYIHEVIKDGFTYEGENEPEQLVIQMKNRPVPPTPFEITKEVENAFKEAVMDKDIAKYLIPTVREKWHLGNSLKGMPRLIQRMKSIISGNQA